MAHLALCRSQPPQPSLTARMPRPRGVLVTTRLERDTAVLRLKGDVDFCSADALRASVAVAIDSGVSRLVLDLGDVEFLDCAGIRLLLTVRELTEAKGGWLRLEHVPPIVSRVLFLTRTHTLLGVDGPDVARP